MPHVDLHDLWTNICGNTVSRRGTSFWDGWSCMCNEVWKVWEERQSVRITFKEFENVSAFSNRREREDMVVSRDNHATALSCTHRSSCRFPWVLAAFMLCLLFRFRTRLLARSSSVPSQFLPFWRCDNETTSVTTVLRTINLLKCTHIFVNRIFYCIPKWDGCLPTSHTFNCIPKGERMSKPHPANREHTLQD